MRSRIEFSGHAATALAERMIDPAWVARVVENPEFSRADTRHPERILAFGRIGEHGGRWLRVVYERNDETYRVVTTFFDRNAEKPA